MKKIFAVMLVLVMMLAMVACGESKAPGTTEETLPENATMAQTLHFDFKSRMKAGESLETMANGLLENSVIQFSGVAMPVEEGYLAGFDQEIHGFTEGYLFAPMIGTIPFVGYLFRTADANAASELVNTLKTNANLRWNICTAADEMICEAVDTTVFFIMAPTSMSN